MGCCHLSKTMRSPRTLPRFFVPSECFLEGQVSLPSEVAHQVQRVLRLTVGDPICLLDNLGSAFICELNSLDSGQATAVVISQQALDTEPVADFYALQSLIKPEKAELVIRLFSQAGGRELWFAPSRRSVAQWDAEKREARARRWQKIAQEDAEVACRARVPELRLWSRWEDALAQLPGRKLLFYEGEGAPLLREIVPEVWQTGETISLIIGPEGGFAPEEVEAMRAQGCEWVSLGPRILRTEVALFYALAQLLR